MFLGLWWARDSGGKNLFCRTCLNPFPALPNAVRFLEVIILFVVVGGRYFWGNECNMMLGGRKMKRDIPLNTWRAGWGLVGCGRAESACYCETVLRQRWVTVIWLRQLKENCVRKLFHGEDDGGIWVFLRTHLEPSRGVQAIDMLARFYPLYSWALPVQYNRSVEGKDRAKQGQLWTWTSKFRQETMGNFKAYLIRVRQYLSRECWYTWLEVFLPLLVG